MYAIGLSVGSLVKVKTKRDHALGIKARIHLPEVPKTAHHKARSDQQSEGQANFQSNQRLLERDSTRTGSPISTDFHGFDEIGPGSSPRWQKTEH